MALVNDDYFELRELLDALHRETSAEVTVATVEGCSTTVGIGPVNQLSLIHRFGSLPGVQRLTIRGDSFGGWEAEFALKNEDILRELRRYKPVGECNSSVQEPSDKGEEENQQDAVNHPSHYASDSGLEAIEVIEAFFHGNAYLANTFKYIARAGKKGGEAKRLEDLKKARWYLDREIKREEAREDS